MKSLLHPLLAFVLCGAVWAADEKPAANFKNETDKVSYSIGVNYANSLKSVKQQGADINIDEVIDGMRDGIGGKAKLDDKEMRETLNAFSQQLRNKRTEAMRAESDQKRKAGEEFLAANAKKPGVKTMPDGLQYKVLFAGKGPQPKAGDRVSAHYRGTLIDGTQFDSSYERGQPLVTSTSGGVIPGWQEVLTNMHVGDKWEVYIPNQLAYGDQPRGKIPAGAALIFEMELLSIEPPQANPNAGLSLPSLNPGTPQIKVAPSPGANKPITVQPAK